MTNITPESVQQLLNSEDFGDRNRGINQLRQLQPETAFEMIQPMITDRNARVRYAAVSQMDTLGSQDEEKALDLLRDRLLNDSEIDVQAAAADAIGALQLLSAFDDLAQVYHSTSEWLLQVSIIAALGEMGDPRGFDLLKEALDSDNDLLKTAAIGSFGELGDSRAIPLLAPYGSDSDWQVRFRLIQALTRLGGAEAKAVIEEMRNDDVEQVANVAQESLAHWGEG